MSELLKEIQEDIRQERLEKIWNQYKGFLISGVTAILIGTASYVGWQSWKEKKEQEHAALFTQALELERGGKFSEAEQMLNSLAQRSDGYAILSKFHLAAMALQGAFTSPTADKKAEDKAIEALMMLERDGRIDPLYRDYACLLHAYITLDQGDPDYLLQKIEHISHKGNPWRLLALEVKAVLHQKKGEIDTATALFKELEMEPQTPHAFKMRIQALARHLSELVSQASSPPPSS